jgi:ComF family protein
MRRLVHLYKYGFIRSLAEPLGIILAQQLEKSALPLPDIALAVPLHPRRLRFRGFNQSELLLQATAKHALFPLTVPEGILLRTRYTKPQQKTRHKQERLENLVDAFTITNVASIKGKTVWLFDDVATTHSTLLACATVLKHAGAKHVYGVVVASVVNT